jgi:hypothetical protein
MMHVSLPASFCMHLWRALSSSARPPFLDSTHHWLVLAYCAQMEAAAAPSIKQDRPDRDENRWR